LLLAAAVAALPHRGSTPVQLSVSGLSSGAFAAVQYHVAFSGDLLGVGVIAGGPYWCAMGTLAYATTACMTQPELIDLTLLWGATTVAANLGVCLVAFPPSDCFLENQCY
jgi:hypothetical protein